MNPLPVNHKYKKQVPGNPLVSIDVYDVLKAYEVQCPAVQHAVKKLLCPGQRGQKTEVQDLNEARASITRAIEFALQTKKENK